MSRLRARTARIAVGLPALSMLAGRRRSGVPFLAVLTPVFDPALAALQALVQALQQQSFGHFVHVSLSNGPSPQVAAFLAAIRREDDRFHYLELPVVATPDMAGLLAELGRRRDHALQSVTARRYLFLDADFRILDRDYFAKLYMAHVASGADLIVTDVLCAGNVLPSGAWGMGEIDMANFSFSRRLARLCRYPTQAPGRGSANDFAYFDALRREAAPVHAPFLAGEVSGNRWYRRLSDRNAAEQPRPAVVPLFGSPLVREDAQGLGDLFASGLVGPGATAKAFAARFAQRMGFPLAVATNSCTNACWVLLRALRLPPGGTVLVPNIQFFAIRNAIELCGLRAKAVDVGDPVPNLTADSVRPYLDRNVVAVVALEYGGYPGDAPGLRRELQAAGLENVPLILDAANSPFTSSAHRPTATDYDYALVSFDMNKIVTTGDGGLLVGRDPAVMERAASLAYVGMKGGVSSGFERSARGGRWWIEGAGEPSLYLAMNDLAATLGMRQLDRIETTLAMRERLRAEYRRRLAPLQEAGLLRLPPEEPNVQGAHMFFWLRLHDEATRDALAHALLAAGVYTNVKYNLLDPTADTPRAAAFFATSLLLPLHVRLTDAQLDLITSCLHGFFAERP